MRFPRKRLAKTSSISMKRVIKLILDFTRVGQRSIEVMPNVFGNMDTDRSRPRVGYNVAFRPCEAMPSGSADTAARDTKDYAKANVIYVAKSLEWLQRGFQRSRALSLVFDEARVVQSKMLVVFASTPLTSDLGQGMLLPPQLRQELYVDLTKRKIKLRIEEAMSATRAGRSGRIPAKPKADPLAATYDLCLSLDNSLKTIFPQDGLKTFMPKLRLEPLTTAQKGRYTTDTVSGQTLRWHREVTDDDGNTTSHRLLPSPHAWQQHPPSVLSFTADQGPENFAMYVHLAFHVGLRVVYFPDLNHIESNLDDGLFTALGLGHMDAKSRFLGRLHRGPQKSPGHWHAQIQNAFTDHLFHNGNAFPGFSTPELATAGMRVGCPTWIHSKI